MLSRVKNLMIRALRWSEQYTKTDMIYLAKNGSWLTAGQVTISLIAFLLSIAFAHFVSKEVYGTYRFLISLFWTLTALGLTGVPVALSRAVAKGDDSSYRYALTLSLLGNIPMAIVSLGLAAYYAIGGNLLLSFGCLIISVLGPLMQGAYLYGAVLEGKRAFRENAIAGILLNALPAILLLLAMQYLQEPLGFLALYLGGSVLVGMGISYIVVRHATHTKATKETRAEFRSVGLHFSAMNVLATISQQADKLLVFHALGPVQLAIYTFAVALPDQLKAVLGNLESLAFPKFAKRKIEEVLPTLGKRLWGLTGLITLVVIAYIIAAPFVFSLFFPAYTDSVFISQVYALSLIPMGGIIPIGLLQAHAVKKELYVFNAVIPVFQIASLWAGITFFGLLGAIAARIITRFITLGLSLILLHQYALRTKQ